MLILYYTFNIDLIFQLLSKLSIDLFLKFLTKLTNIHIFRDLNSFFGLFCSFSRTKKHIWYFITSQSFSFPHLITLSSICHFCLKKMYYQCLNFVYSSVRPSLSYSEYFLKYFLNGFQSYRIYLDLLFFFMLTFVSMIP